MNSTEFSKFTSNLTTNLYNIFSSSNVSNSKSLKQNLQVINQVFGVLDSLTNKSSISIDTLNSTLNVFDSMLSQNAYFFTSLDTIFTGGDKTIQGSPCLK